MDDEKDVKEPSSRGNEWEKDVKEPSSRGNEWEVVSLTASTYAAAPGPETFVSNDDDDNNGNEVDRDEVETSRAMFMSGHFVFPPSQHENLPLESDSNEPEEVGTLEKNLGLDVEQGDRSDKNDDGNWNVKGLTVADELHGIQFFDEEGKRLSVRPSEFEEGKSLPGLNLAEEEQSVYDTAKSSSFHDNTDISGSSLRDEELIEPSDPVQPDLDAPSDSTQSTGPLKENKYKGSNLPCEAWWKRQGASLFAQAKDANALWSVFVAAALMGIVIIGHRWQTQQLKWQFAINDEKMNRVLGPIARIKNVIISSSHRPGSVIRGSTSGQR